MSRSDKLFPFIVAGCLLAGALVFAVIVPEAWALLLLLAPVGAAGALLKGERFGLDREYKRRETAIAVFLGGVWAAFAVRSDAWSSFLFWLLLGTLLLGIPHWKRKRAGRSKAHGSTRDQERRAKAVERWLLEPLQSWDGEQWETSSRWEQFAAQGGIAGSTVLRVEAVPTGLLLRVELLPGSTIEQARSARGALESAMDLRPGAITVEQDTARARVVLLKLRETAPDPEPIPWSGPPRDASIYDPVQLGVYIDADGGPLEHSLYGQHVLIAGASGSGKSVTLNIEVAHVAACRDARPLGIDLKGGAELGPWADAGVLDRVATTTPEAEELLEWVVTGILDVRGPQLGARGLRSWQCTPQEPAYVVFIDEHGRLSYSDRAKKALVEIVERGRALGVILVTCLQKPSVGALGSNRISPNISVRIVHRVANTNEVGVAVHPGAVSDGWAAHEIPKGQKGALYLHAEDAETPRLARAFYATDAKVKDAARRLGRVVTPRAGLAIVPPPGAVPTENTESDQTGEVGGGEVLGAEHDLLRRLLTDAGEEGIADRELVEQTGMSLPWVKKWRQRFGAAQVERGYWRLP